MLFDQDSSDAHPSDSRKTNKQLIEVLFPNSETVEIHRFRTIQCAIDK